MAMVQILFLVHLLHTAAVVVRDIEQIAFVLGVQTAVRAVAVGVVAQVINMETVFLLVVKVQAVKVGRRVVLIQNQAAAVVARAGQEHIFTPTLRNQGVTVGVG
jgi:hypothetical protein